MDMCRGAAESVGAGGGGRPSRAALERRGGRTGGAGAWGGGVAADEPAAATCRGGEVPYKRVMLSSSRIGLLLGVLLGCNEQDGHGVPASAAKIQSTCQSYCDHARTCDDEVVVASCVAKCRDRIGDCMADEQSTALDDLGQCAREGCDDFNGCTIGAGLRCTFGL